MVCIRTGATGPNFSRVSAFATGAHSIGEAMRAIRHGYADGMIAGGTEATIAILGVGGFNAMRAMSTRNDAPEKASRPFDKDRDGFIPAEGAAVFVVETLAHARARGARVLAEVAGCGITADAYHIVAPCEDGAGAARAIRMAMRQAGVEAAQIDYVN